VEDIFDIALRRTFLGRSVRLRRGHAEWKAGSTLQLQRIAHENLGLGTWKRTDESVPVTNRGEVLGTFDVKDEKHARLVDLKVKRKAQGLRSDSLQFDPQTEGNIHTSVLDNSPVSAGSRFQYHRVPNTEHASA
jgi:hypothetical protein